MSLWTASEAAAATGGQVASDWSATGVSIDTRTLKPGELFIALTAARDGHDFVAQALGKGASAALVSRIPDGCDPEKLLIVSDVQGALEALGQAARARTRARVVAVTGSVGKTSTKEMLRTVLSAQGTTHAADASYNNHWGVPLTLARMPADTDYAVIEIGMNHPGEIAPLAHLARPHVAMVTTVAAAHLEAFEDLDGIAVEKASIVEGVEPGGTILLNADVAQAPALARTASARADVSQVWFGQTGSDWTLTDVRLSGEATVISASHGAEEYLFKLSIPGRHFATNALAVLAAAEALGADADTAARDIANWRPPEGRGTREDLTLDAVREETLTLIDDAFNANPTSMAASLEVLAATKPVDGVGRIVKGRRIAILGDMLELGPTEISDHAGLATNPHLAQADIVHCVGPRMKHLHDALPERQRGQWVPEADALCTHPARLVDAGDVVLVKGSKGSYVSRVVDAIRKLGHR